MLIIFSHLTFTGQFQRDFVSLFNVPVFFILSGYFFKDTTFRDSFSKGVRRYLIPAYIFLLFDILKDVIVEKNKLFFCDISYFFKTILFLGGAFKNFPLWFLIVLFFVIIIFNSIKNDSARLVLSVLLIVINNYITIPFSGYFWPVCILYGFPFFYIGYILKRKSINLEKDSCFYGFIISLLILLVATKIIGYNSMTEQSFNRGYILFLFSGILGFYSIVSLSYVIVYIPIRKYLIMLGTHTKFILLTHYYICRVLLIKILDGIGCEYQKYNIIFQLFAVVCLIFMYAVFFEVFNKYSSDTIKKIFRNSGIL